MPKLIEIFCSIYFYTPDWEFFIPEALYIIGLWPLFRKSGVKSWWALVPYARDYMFARCAGCEKEGRVLAAIRVLNTIVVLAGNTIDIITFSISALAVSLALIIVVFIYNIRIYKGICDTYGKSRWWILLWLPVKAITALIWGFSGNFTPRVQAHELDIDDRIQEEKVHGKHTWLKDLGENIKRLLSYFAFRFDWINLPIAVLITTIVASIAKNDFFTTMDGTIKGSLALTCIAIWNGCFNSIKTVCRERKELHRLKDSGMYLSSYILSVIIYQAILCAIQTLLTIYTCTLIGIKFPDQGLVINSLFYEIGITLFLISFAADLLCLCISAMVREVSTAMTIMPFVLVIQLVFSGSVINIQAWSHSISRFTISNYGVKCIAAQADYNNRPMVLGWNLLDSIRDNDVGKVYKVGDLMDILQDPEHYPGIRKVRETDIGGVFTVGEIREKIESNKTVSKLLDKDLGLDMTIGEILERLTGSNIIPTTEELKDHTFGKVFTVKEIYDMLSNVDAFKNVKDKKIFNLFSVGGAMDAAMVFLGDIKIKVQFKLGDLVDTIMNSSLTKSLMNKQPFEGLTIRQLLEKLKVYDVLDTYKDQVIDARINVGKLIDYVLALDVVQEHRSDELDLRFRIGDIISLVGEERVHDFVIEKTSSAVYFPEYDHTRENVEKYWNALTVFILIFGAAFVLIMEVGMRGLHFKKKQEPEAKE